MDKIENKQIIIGNGNIIGTGISRIRVQNRRLKKTQKSQIN